MSAFTLSTSAACTQRVAMRGTQGASLRRAAAAPARVATKAKAKFGVRAECASPDRDREASRFFPRDPSRATLTPPPIPPSPRRPRPDVDPRFAAPLTRNDVTEKIVFNRMKKGITWAALAEAVGKSLPWTTSALLGQHQMSEEEAKAAGDMLDLTEDEIMLLTYVPFKGSFGKPGELVPTDPLIYRFYEMVMVYGTTYKEMIHEEFGDGIMSAIDFDMEFARQPNGDLGDRVKIVLTGKYLTYKKF